MDNLSALLDHCGDDTRNARIRIINAVKQDKIKDWINAGASDDDLARLCVCTKKQLHDLARRWPTLQTLLDAPRQTQLANAWTGLIKLAGGFYVKTHKVHRKTIYRADGSEENVQEEFEDEDYYPPSVNACKAVIQNYAKALQKSGGVQMLPTEYVEDDRAVIASDEEMGRLPEMEEALKGVFGSYEVAPREEEETLYIEQIAKENDAEAIEQEKREAEENA